MEVDLTDDLVFRNKVHMLSVSQLDQIVEEAKNKMEIEEDMTNQFIAKLEYIRIQISIFRHKANDQDPKVFEEIYQQVITDSPPDPSILPLPSKYKVDFAYLLFEVFKSNGGYTRCEKLLQLLKDQFNLCKEDDHTAFKYYCTYLSVSIHYMTLFYKNPEEYLQDIPQEVLEKEFNEEMLVEIEFLKNKLFYSFYSSRDAVKRDTHRDKLFEVLQQHKTLFYITEFLSCVNDGGKKLTQKAQEQINSTLDMLKDELQAHPEPEMALCNLNLAMFNLTNSLDNINTITDTISTLLAHHNLSLSSSLFYKISCLFFAFISNPRDFDQGQVFKLRKEFEQLSLSDTTEIHYNSISSFGLLVRIQEVIGTKVDYQIPLKYCEALKEDKLTYIGFLSSLQTIQDGSIKPYVATAIEYCDELKIDKTHHFRLGLDIQNIELQCKLRDVHTQKKAFKMYEELTQVYEQNPSEAINQKLRTIYIRQLNILNDIQNPEKYVEIALKYLATQTQTNSQNVPIYEKTIDLLLFLKNFEKASEIVETFLKNATEQGVDTKEFHTALQKKVAYLYSVKNYEDIIAESEKFLNNAIEQFGDISSEHSHALREISRTQYWLRNYQEAYEGFEAAYDIEQERFGSEDNPEGADILMYMSFIKRNLKEFKEAYALIDKALKIEEKVNSKFSKNYKIFLEAKKSIKKREKEALNLKDNNPRPKTKPFSKFKLSCIIGAATVTTIGAIYYFRSKNED